MNNLKSKIRSLQKDGGDGRTVEEMNELVDLMKVNIGSVDKELRDELIYWTFDKLIRSRKIDPGKLKDILEELTGPGYLFFGLGKTGDDSVFTRSFSALVIGSIIQLDAQDHFLPDDKLQNVLSCAITYLEAELDTRGYVTDKGWAHSISHGANLLEGVVKHPGFSIQDFNRVLTALAACLFKGVVYIDDEDYSLIRVITGAVQTDSQYKVLVDWVSSIADKLRETGEAEGQSLIFFRIQTNILNFLKSLYFALQSENYPDQVLQPIKAEIMKLTSGLH